jgi:putative PEP-CTERM system TPR-repeat lipoprotein
MMRNLLFTVMLLSLAACGDTTSAEFLARAKQHLAGADPAAAEIELKNALRLDGNSPEARLLLGKIYLDKDDNLAAEKELLLAQSLGGQADEVRPALARALLAQAKTADVLALKHDDLERAAAAQLLSVQAVAAMLDGKDEQAAELISAARVGDPQSQDAKLAEARLLALRGQTAAAFTVIDQILESAPANAEAWRLQGHVLWRQQKLEEARAAIDQAIANSTITFSDYLSRALINLQLHNFTGAAEDSAELTRQLRKNPGTSYVRGLLYFNNKDYRKAITAFTRAKYAAPKYPLMLYYLSLAYALEGDLDVGSKFARQYVELAPNDIQGRKLLALFLLHQNNAVEAQKVLQPILDFNPNEVSALNLMAGAQLLNNQADLGLLLYARISALNPSTTVAQMPLSEGVLTAGLGLAADAAGDLENRLNNQPEFPRKDVLLALAHLQRKEYAQAIAAAESYMWRASEKTAPYNVIGNIYLSTGQLEQAAESYRKALLRDPADPSANINLAQLARDKRDAAAERGHYKAVLEKHPDNLAALLRLAVLEGRENNSTGMVALLQQAVDLQPAALEPRLGLARYYLNTGNAAQVAPLFSSLIELQQRSPRVLELYAQAQLAQQRYAAAYFALEQLVAMSPESAQFQYWFWQAATGVGNREKAQQALAEALRLEPEHLPSIIAAAGIAQSEGQQELFAQRLATAIKLAPEDPGVLRLRSSAARRAGDIQAASAFSEQAYARQASAANFLEVMENRKASGQQTSALRAMQQWLESHPDDIAVRLALSDILQAGNDMQAAQLHYRKVLFLQPDNVHALNNLAWNLRVENPAKALEYIRRAARVAPGEPAVLDTMAVIEHLNGENGRANASIQRALAAAPDNPSLLYHQAMIDAALGNTAAAIAALEALLGAADSDFPERAEAAELLRKLKG